MKRCPRCGEEKPTSEFNRNRSRKDGFAHYCKPCNLAWKREHYARTDQRWRLARHLRRHYGMSLEDYDRILDAQGGVCAVCRTTPKTFHVDHSHATGVVRGLLCGGCNTGLGHLRDDPNIAGAAALYLIDHNEREPA